MLKNPKSFYSCQRKFSKTSEKITGFINENGEIVTDAFKQSEMLRKQYQSLYSQAMGKYLVEEDFFTGCEDCLQQLTHECWEDKWNYPDVEPWKPDSCSHRNGTLPFCLLVGDSGGSFPGAGVGDTGTSQSAPLANMGCAPGAKIVPHYESDTILTISEAGGGDSDCLGAGNQATEDEIFPVTGAPGPATAAGTKQCAPLAKLGCAPGAKIVPHNQFDTTLTLPEVGGGDCSFLEAGTSTSVGDKISPTAGVPGCSDCNILHLAGIEEGDMKILRLQLTNSPEVLHQGRMECQPKC